ncbi:MAG TPA: DedA family protein [Candidatus Paceibacterota bacterium]|jgi:membrane protein DedA with SNARE-associated domain|nr:DedA family protein [Candidatus Paceibacterota bacterium]
MNDFVALLLSFLLLYKYWALFTVIFLAAVIVPFPSNSILLATGAFASQGYFSFPLSLTVAVGANILGDCVDYFLARRYGNRALTLLHIRLPIYIKRLEEFMRKHPGSTIFITRFVGTVEEVVSFLSGFIGIPFSTFLIYDTLGNVISDGGILYAGYFLGVHWQDFSTLFSVVGWILLGIIIIAALSVALWYRSKLISHTPTRAPTCRF